MFESNFLEFFSKIHWTAPLWLFVPVIVAFYYFALTTFQFTTGEILVRTLLGLFVWTITEYSMHRWVFHFHAKSESMKKLFWTFHGVHHDYPSDPLRLVMPPSVSIPLSTGFFFLFVWIMGYQNVSAFMPGFVLGYLFYDITHYGIHFFPIKNKVFGRLRELHMRHHFQTPDLIYGVSSPAWDYVFGTMLKPEHKKVSIVEPKE